ncbi:MAG: heparan-alpha-glucosaminide N-acetyltransferase [Caldilineaceae bacterium]
MVMMVIFHLLWDFWAFQIMPNLVLYAGFWKYFQRTTAITFLLVVGVSLTVSYRREVKKNRGAKPGWHKYVIRGLRIFGIGMCFTLFGLLSGFGYVHIGILHLIGIAIIVSYPLLTYRWINLILWAIFVIIGGIVLRTNLDHNWLVYLGLHRPDYYPLDYFPIFPWLGVVLLGVFLGNTFYGPEGRIILLPDLSDALLVRGLRFLGRHSLIIYVIHQPLMIAILFALGLAHMG